MGRRARQSGRGLDARDGAGQGRNRGGVAEGRGSCETCPRVWERDGVGGRGQVLWAVEDDDVDGRPRAGRAKGPGRNDSDWDCRLKGFRGWEVEHGGNGWAVEKNLTLVPGAPSQTCFVTSFQWCFKRQLVDLVMEGVWQELLDSAQIEICVADWWGARENCGCIYRLRVRLLDVYENEVVKFSASPNPVLQWTERGCRQVSHVFTNFGKGIRYVSFEQYGRDTRSWVGHYGALVTHSSVRVRIRLS
ncbi:F-box only protein 17 isoform X2 [Lutra lutra]|uniref:F-box only protein 17 isoform X2 n=1 Tax=Lutra lutra TaxID=9657 RepID=UPI001FD20315|nr:F-box only protein 17 isoform X2 [Lutra lutra]